MTPYEDAVEDRWFLWHRSNMEDLSTLTINPLFSSSASRSAPTTSRSGRNLWSSGKSRCPLILLGFLLRPLPSPFLVSLISNFSPCHLSCYSVFCYQCVCVFFFFVTLSSLIGVGGGMRPSLLISIPPPSSVVFLLCSLFLWWVLGGEDAPLGVPTVHVSSPTVSWCPSRLWWLVCWPPGTLLCWLTPLCIQAPLLPD